MLKAARAIVAASLLALAACGGEGDAPPLSAGCAERLAEVEPSPSLTPTPGKGRPIDSRLECGRNEIRITGAVEARATGNLILRIVEIRRDDVPRVTWFLSAALVEPLRLADGTSIKVAFDVAPGEYAGDGTYRATGQGRVKVDENVQSPFRTDAFVEAINASTQPPTYAKFDKPVQPCTIEVSHHGSAGRVECPKAADEQGREVAFTWTWRTARRR